MPLNLVFIVRINCPAQYYNLENTDILMTHGTGTTLNILGPQLAYWNGRVLSGHGMTDQFNVTIVVIVIIVIDRYLGQSCLVSQDVTHFVLVENWQDYKDRNLLSQRRIIYDNVIPYNCCSMLILY